MQESTKTNIRIKNYVILSDFIVLNVVLFLFTEFCRSTGSFGCETRLLFMAATVNLTMIISQYFYSTIVHRRRSTVDQIMRQVTMLVALQGALSFVTYEIVFPNEGLAAPDVDFQIVFTFLLYICIFISRYAERLILKYYRRIGRNTRHVVFIGSDDEIVELYDTLIVKDPAYGYRCNGYYADKRIKDCPKDLEYKGDMAELESIINSNAKDFADDIYCCLPVPDEEFVRKLARYCNNNFLRFYYVPTVARMLGLSMCQERIGNLIVFTNHLEPMMHPANKFVKRAFDILVSGIILIPVCIATPFIALIIKLQSPGPIFFKQARTGLNGHNFYCYKFRSMHVNKDADKVQATENDPRKFAFGNFMRKANIDELPQFFNVFKGDMSIVGPRPHMLLHTEIYSKLIDKYMVRHFVKPGITGWAQVTGYRGETKELWQMEGRVKRDIWYINNWSIWLDLRIIAMTAVQIFVHDKNAY